ncbi:MAG: NAD(P)H-dependent oxidoreductase [Deltaproteobacteria bacterium]|nr:NAD(P)H-dependent oxidoreductase [Deltaproteobacteria bacterium]
MKVLVFNGSPKGKTSITQKHVEFFSMNFPEVEFRTVYISKEIKKFENSSEYKSETLKFIDDSDLILFAWPVYYMSVPAPYLRFFEIIQDLHLDKHFSGKSGALFSTSIHFFDHTSHDYVRSMCDILDMNFTCGLSAHMEDMTKTEGAAKMIGFMKKAIRLSKNNHRTPKQFEKIISPEFRYNPGKACTEIDSGESSVVILTDHGSDSNLGSMVERFAGNFKFPPRIVHLREAELVSGCMGCLKCAGDQICIFNNKDNHRKIVEEIIVPSDMLVIAADLRHGYFSAEWQKFLTRLFYNGHVPLVKNKFMGFLFSGGFNKRPFIREIFEGFLLHSDNSILEFISDEVNDSKLLDTMIDSMAVEMMNDFNEKYIPFMKFPAVGAHKLFRDEVYGRLGFVFEYDYKHFKSNKLFDFPTGKPHMSILRFLLSSVLKIPPFRRRFYMKEMIPGMLRPYDKVLKKIKTKTP